MEFRRNLAQWQRVWIKVMLNDTCRFKSILLCQEVQYTAPTVLARQTTFRSFNLKLCWEDNWHAAYIIRLGIALVKLQNFIISNIAQRTTVTIAPSSNKLHLAAKLKVRNIVGSSYVLTLHLWWIWRRVKSLGTIAPHERSAIRACPRLTDY